ncbi:DUF6776 family protein [Halopseudomonas maritima]|uniref:DUF6776 family protein n=1 Tax=Halopseudomonas maritima TaxID=2918528 RepID=UPI001EEB69CF|nr:DUF6776 family protein [Halopseudomonas maritima]UJJ32817.1 hypothetical protein HV822_06625 [Halopseudomonas maritima]
MLLTAIPVSAWLGWESAMRRLAPVAQEREQLLEHQGQLVQELESQRQQYHQMEVDLLVARESVAEGQQVIRELEAQLFRQQQSLAQYQGVLAPDAMSPGLRIQAFELHATDDPQVFAYKIMVSRVGDESDMLQAGLDLAISGERDGEAATLPLAELAPDAEADVLALNFRYFQVVPARSEQAQLRLPDGFVPKQVTLTASDGDDTLVEQSFDWTVTGVVP